MSSGQRDTLTASIKPHRLKSIEALVGVAEILTLQEINNLLITSLDIPKPETKSAVLHLIASVIKQLSPSQQERLITEIEALPNATYQAIALHGAVRALQDTGEPAPRSLDLDWA